MTTKLKLKIKRLLVLALSIAMFFLLFSINVIAGDSGETNPQSNPIGDSGAEETETEVEAEVEVVESGIANGISPFANGLITDLSAGTKLDINTLYGLKDGNWTIRADGYFIQADDLAPILDSVTEIFTNYVTLSKFGHFLIIYNYSDSQGVRTIGPLPVLSPAPDPNWPYPLWGGGKVGFKRALKR